MYALQDTPFGDLTPIVKLDVLFTRKQTTNKAYFEVLVYEASYANHIGFLRENATDVEFCCTYEMQQLGACLHSEIRHVIRRPEKHIHILKVEFNEGAATSNITKEVFVNETGNYILQISNCDDVDVGDLVIEGSFIWLNPYGYLPGEVYMNLPISGALSGYYFILLIFYSFLCIKYRKILMTLQWGIFAVILYSMIDLAAWCFYRSGINDSGYYSQPALIVLVLLANMKKTAVRVLVLLVSMGLGVVKWTLGTTRIKIALLATFYLFFSFLFQTINEMEALAKHELVSQWLTLLIIIPNAILDTSFYYWIILSLIRTMQQLTLRQQVLKLKMYKLFFALLVLVGALAASMIIYQGYIRISESTIPWKNEWLIESYWELLFLIVVTGIAFLWRPRSNNARYGYGEFFQNDGNDEKVEDEDDKTVPLETINISTGGELTQRKKRKVSDSSENVKPVGTSTTNYDSDREKNIKASKIKLSDFDKDVLSIDLPSDDENEISLETQVKKMD
eukprot:TRINITY_DN1367_c1_g1_i1.p1 TRINITY_DN1367_c1_g1~~TRINITY_DN1367_c1_g1_i1.p1  ORF type:complete len:556 (-),score=117.03 TRINITY_DN1367_c1_g1_i1:279-1799(-)